MADAHDLNDLPCNGCGVLLLNQLRKDAFEIGETHQLRQFGGRCVGQNSSPPNHHDSFTDLLHRFQHVRDI